MTDAILLGGLIGAGVSIACCYLFVELSVAYWAPRRAKERWLRLIDLPKLRYFAPSFKWFMPAFALLMLVQLLICIQMVIGALSANGVRLD